MIILKKDEVNLDKILKRFEKIVDFAVLDDVDLGFPEIGEKWYFANQYMIHLQDYKAISAAIQKDVTGKEYSLIVVDEPYVKDRHGRYARVNYDCYKEKDQ